MKRVYVVAWHYETGGGFDWYYNKKVADDKFEEEKAICHNNKNLDWKAYRFDAVVSSYETATEEIDEHLDYYCENAISKYQA